MTDNINNLDNPKGTEPEKTDKGAKSQTFDPSKLGDEDFIKVFEDPRVWKHERFKQLNDLAKEAKELKKAEEDRKEKELEKQKEFKELSDKYKSERDDAITKLQQSAIDNKIISLASKSGVVDLEAVLKLIGRDKITVDEHGVITGAETAIEELLKEKAYLKSGTTAPTIGSGTNPSSDGKTAGKFTLSQIQDPKFYQEHKDEIVLAYKTPGGIIDDTSGQ